jgi:hypothetical protein
MSDFRVVATYTGIINNRYASHIEMRKRLNCAHGECDMGNIQVTMMDLKTMLPSYDDFANIFETYERILKPEHFQVFLDHNKLYYYKYKKDIRIDFSMLKLNFA